MEDDENTDKLNLSADEKDEKDEKPEEFGGDEGGEDSAPETDDSEAGDTAVGTVIGLVESGDIKQKDLDALMAALQTRATESAMNEPETVGAPVPGPDQMSKTPATPVTLEALSARFTALEKTNAQLQGKVAAFEARDAERDAADGVEADVREGLRSLEGLPCGADIETRLRTYRERLTGENATELFKEFVDTFRSNTPLAKHAANDARRFSTDPGAKVPKLVQKYSHNGTDAMEKAAHYCDEYDRLADLGSGMRASKEAYVASNMRRWARKTNRKSFSEAPPED